MLNYLEMLARITDRKLRISLLFCAAILISVSAIAQTQISLNKDLPQMMVRVCPTLEDAQQEASLAKKIGKEPYREGALSKLRNQECRLVYASVTPLREETSIQPFSTWAIKFDEQGSETVRAPAFGANTKIKISLQKSQVHYYFANFDTSSGQSASGWVEIPEEPYIFAFLEDQKKKSSNK